MTKAKAKLTRESLHLAVLPPNNCGVKRFRESIADEDREVFDEAMGYDKKDLSAVALRDWLKDQGFVEEIIPAADHISAHRNGTRPCRCRG